MAKWPEVMVERPLLATGLAAGTNDSHSNRRVAISWSNLVDAFRLNPTNHESAFTIRGVDR